MSDQTIKANTPAYRLRVAARRAVRNAIARGDLIKPSRCEQCGKTTPKRQLHAHHADYNSPLEVDWWCQTCHAHHHTPSDPAPNRTRSRREELVLILQRHGVGYIPGLLRDLGGYVARAEREAREGA